MVQIFHSVNQELTRVVLIKDCRAVVMELFLKVNLLIIRIAEAGLILPDEIKLELLAMTEL